MNANQIINMVVRMVMRQVMRRGVNAGISAVGNRVNKDKSPEQRGDSPKTAETQKRARQAMRVSRKIGKL